MAAGVARVVLFAICASLSYTAAVTCPDLPADTTAAKLSLIAATYNTTSTQQLAFNGTHGWGPTLRLTLGRLYQIDVTNADIQEGTTVHWHGQRLLNASWADGAAGLTQGAIPPGGTFTYRFLAEPAGTHWYHSHMMGQFGDGLRGALVVTDPADPLKEFYDEDQHLMLLADVFNSSLAQQLASHQAGSAPMAMCAGMDISDAPFYAIEINGQSFTSTGRAAVFTVKQGKQYRYRTVGGMSSWALRVSVEGHNITLIALDGHPIAPAAATAFEVNSGERADFVLTADQPVANYWINVATLTGHNSPAILHYEGAPDPATDPAFSETSFTSNFGCLDTNQPGVVGVKQAAALKAGPNVPSPPQESSRQITLYLANAGSNLVPASFAESATLDSNAYGFSASSAETLPAAGSAVCPEARQGAYCWSMNWKVFQMPPQLPIYSAANNGSAIGTAADNAYTITLKQGEVVDLALINTGYMVHPMHLHGASFWVLAAGVGNILAPDGTINTTAAGYNLVDPAFRDMISVQTARITSDTTMVSRNGHDGMGTMLEASDVAGLNTSGTSQPMDSGSASTSAGGGHGGHGGGSPAPMQSPPNNFVAGPSNGGHGGHTPMVPISPDDLGYAVIRFRADNPGVWAFHCHIDLHSMSGMMMLFTVAPTVSTTNTSWYAPAGLQCTI